MNKTTLICWCFPSVSRSKQPTARSSETVRVLTTGGHESAASLMIASVQTGACTNPQDWKHVHIHGERRCVYVWGGWGERRVHQVSVQVHDRRLHPFIIQNKVTKNLQITTRSIRFPDQSDYQINQIARSIRLLVQSGYQINQITSSIRLRDQSDQRGRERDGGEVNDLALVLISRILRFLTPSAQFTQTDGETEEKETKKQINR